MPSVLKFCCPTTATSLALSWPLSEMGEGRQYTLFLSPATSSRLPAIPCNCQGNDCHYSCSTGRNPSSSFPSPTLPLFLFPFFFYDGDVDMLSFFSSTEWTPHFFFPSPPFGPLYWATLLPLAPAPSRALARDKSNLSAMVMTAEKSPWIWAPTYF